MIKHIPIKPPYLLPEPPTETELNDPNVTILKDSFSGMKSNERTSIHPTPIKITITSNYRQNGKDALALKIAKMLEQEGYVDITLETYVDVEKLERAAVHTSEERKAFLLQHPITIVTH